ncbi:MAG: Ig-like domain-containing protein, partial [Nitriliruptorales bacterium]|nr:Ig-like domain-containing protein [Nitriliruptorales bacterium]
MNASVVLSLRVVAAAMVVAGSGAIAWVLTADEPAIGTVGPPRAWVDQPLDGSLHPVAPIDVVTHATDPDGVTAIVIEVDGQEQTRLETDGGMFVEAHWTWTPSAGTHE